MSSHLKERRLQIVAKYPGMCECGCRVKPGSRILYNTLLRKVVGCFACDYTGRPIDYDEQDPRWGYTADDYSIVHNQ